MMPAHINISAVFYFCQRYRRASLIALCMALPSLTSAATPEVAIAGAPLFDQRVRVPANVLLSLSIDISSVGAAYRSGAAATYDRTFDYAGYFNPTRCYKYTGPPGNYFEINYSVLATSLHECDGTTFSGNFMNWASMSTIDLLRYGLTGGDRATPETATATFLQRAMLPASFFDDNSALFPRRVITTTSGGNVSSPSKVTPFSNSSGITVVSCANKIIIADNSASIASCAAPVKTTRNTILAAGLAGEYVVRVKVCDIAEGPMRTDLCQRFGSNFKPVGSLQRNAGKARFGLMSYLPDTSDNRYGGVLRAPMKFLGPKEISVPSYAETDNAHAEWDSATGVLHTNPDDPANRNSSSVKSGMINFINQFGRTGLYKNFFDPLSELYYEGIRYFQGSQPTANATAGMIDALKEGFPVYSSWSDPVIASCQRNQMLVVADANTNYDFYVPGNTRVDQLDIQRAAEAAVPSRTPALNAVLWTQKLGAMEADATSSAGNPAPNSRLANLDQRLTGYLDYAGFYISGLAYWANTNPIRLDKSVRVKTVVIDTDEGGNGMIDYADRSPSRPRESQLYLAAKYGGFDDVSGEATPNPYVTLAADGLTRVRNTTHQWDANRDGIPDNYSLASQPGTMVNALQKITPGPLTYSSATMSTPAVSSSRISPNESFLFQASFHAPKWHGTLKKLAISAADASSPLQIATTATWEAGDLLSGAADRPANPLPASRSIYTAKRAGDRSLATIPFDWTNLAQEQKAMLNRSPVIGGIDNLAESRVNYLRGSRSDELGQTGGQMRVRASVLGDIVNSNVVLVGAPAANIPGAAYAAFYDANKTRSPTLYVGSNDGMLHAFDAGSGIEKFAYIPAMLMPLLSQLTSPEYLHRPYVDGQIAVAEARVGSNWKTVLASGLGGGAQGVFALDVTNPADFSQGSGVLFEFTDEDDPDIGNLMGPPVIAKFRTRVTNGVAEYKYFVVVPSGLNNYRPDDSTASGTPKYNAAAPGALFLLSLDKPAGEAWSKDVNYYKLSLPNLAPELQSGVSPPALVVGSDGAVRFAYAGDLQGNLWRINFTGLPPWSDGLGANPNVPLFSAVDPKSDAKADSKADSKADPKNEKKQVAQPITTQPTVVFAPGGGHVVLFGTGKYLEPDDLGSSDFTGQSFYAIYDTTRDEDKPVSRSQLASRDLKFDTAVNAYTLSGKDFVYGTDALSKKGWFMDFPNASSAGERQVSNSLVLDGQLYFNTIAPGIDPCSHGVGRAYSMNALTGLSGTSNTGYLSSIGFLGAPVVFQMGAVSSGRRNALGKREASKTVRVLHVGSGSGSGSTPPVSVAAAPGNPTTLTVPAGRFSWREILNWQELRSEALKN